MRGPMSVIAGVLALAIVQVAAGCRREPDFDERYEATQKEIRDTAARIDKEMKLREREAVQAGNTLAPAASTTPESPPTQRGDLR